MSKYYCSGAELFHNTLFIYNVYLQNSEYTNYRNDNQSSHNNMLSNVHIQWIQIYTELFHKTLLIV